MGWRYKPPIEKKIAFYREIRCRVIYLIMTTSIIGIRDAYNFSDSSDIDRIVRSVMEKEKRPISSPELDQCPYCNSPRP